MRNGIGGAKCHTFPKIANFCKVYFSANSLFATDEKISFKSFKSFNSYVREVESSSLLMNSQYIIYNMRAGMGL